MGIHGITVVAVDYSREDTYGFHSKYCSETLVAPHYKRDPQSFLNFLIDYAKKQSNPPVLIPTVDPYVEFVDEYLMTLREYFLIPQTEQGLYTKIMDKGTLYDLVVEHAVKVPETVFIDEENFTQKVEEFIKFPCLIKPVDSHAFVSKFRRKLFKVYDKEELLAKIDMANEANIKVVV